MNRLYDVPKDKGWSWMVMIGVAICMFYMVGMYKSLGLLFVEFLNEYQASSAMTAWMFGCAAFFMSALAPASNYLASRYTCRLTVALGTFSCSLAFFLTSFAHSINMVVLCFGILSGVGYALIWGPSLMMIGPYFESRRSFANGLAMAGSSIGQLLIPPLMTFVINTYSLRGALIIYAAFNLNGFVAAMLLRPPSFYKRKKHEETKENIQAKLSEVEELAFIQKDSKQCDWSSQVEADQSNPSMQSGSVGDQRKDQSENLVKRTDTQTSHNCNSSLQNGICVQSVHLKNTGGCIKSSKLCSCFLNLYQWHHFKNDLFIIFAICHAIGVTNYLNHIVYIPARAIEIGVPKTRATQLLSLVGVCDLVGRICGGFIADFKFVRRSYLMGGSLVVLGCVSIVTNTVATYYSMIALSTAIGLCGGVFVGLLAVVLLDFVGMQSFPGALGLSVMCQGFLNTGWPSFLGYLADVTGSYGTSLYVAGVCVVLSGSVMFLETCARRLEENKLKSDKNVI